MRDSMRDNRINAHKSMVYQLVMTRSKIQWIKVTFDGEINRQKQREGRTIESEFHTAHPCLALPEAQPLMREKSYLDEVDNRVFLLKEHKRFYYN